MIVSTRRRSLRVADECSVFEPRRSERNLDGIIKLTRREDRTGWQSAWSRDETFGHGPSPVALSTRTTASTFDGLLLRKGAQRMTGVRRVLEMYGWLFYRLGQKEPEELVEAAPVAAPAGS